MLDDEHLFTVTDLKQFAYCARVVFYERCLPHVRPRTYKMEAGRDAHEAEQRRAARRTLAQYDQAEGKRVFNLRLSSDSLRLTGILDEAVYCADGTIFPVDYKLAKQVSAHYRLQLASYALLLEEAEATTVDKGFVYLIPKREMVPVRITEKLRTQVLAALEQMSAMVEREKMPDPAPTSNFCVACEFRRFCNDV
ncbi:MAG TPA: CRISPR-associated protein Cas4 [Bellilinea sp.]|nr:CRISPR-associated protein Cas4 [Bellilinea sp.]